MQSGCDVAALAREPHGSDCVLLLVALLCESAVVLLMSVPSILVLNHDIMSITRSYVSFVPVGRWKMVAQALLRGKSGACCHGGAMNVDDGAAVVRWPPGPRGGLCARLACTEEAAPRRGRCGKRRTTERGPRPPGHG